MLWDQMRLFGQPRRLLRGCFRCGCGRASGALRNDAWLEALEASTQPIVVGNGGVRFRVLLGFCPRRRPVAAAIPWSRAQAHRSLYLDAGSDSVQVVSEDVVGPYDVAVVRATQGSDVIAWLRGNEYTVDALSQGTLGAYALAGFDFMAVRFRPGAGVQATQPIRVVTTGSDTTLPLRMMAAGSGDVMPIELFVLSAGAYQPSNFPEVTFIDTILQWDYVKRQSNYDAAVTQLLSAGAGTGWLTESSQLAEAPVRAGFNPSLSDTYASLCATGEAPGSAVGCAVDGGDATDDGSTSRGPDAAPSSTGDDAGSLGAGACVAPAACDDFAVATSGIGDDRLLGHAAAGKPAADRARHGPRVDDDRGAVRRHQRARDHLREQRAFVLPQRRRPRLRDPRTRRSLARRPPVRAMARRRRGSALCMAQSMACEASARRRMTLADVSAPKALD